MSWINASNGDYVAKNTNYNRSVICNSIGINSLIGPVDTAIGFLKDIRDEIASISLYPIKFKYPEGGYTLSTSKGRIEDVPTGSYKPLTEINSYRNVGQIFIKPKYNNYADYKGYTQIKLFLPMLGFVDIDPNECMGKWLQIRLKIDFTTGKGIYIVGVSDDQIPHTYMSFILEGEDQNIRVISNYECDIGIEIPLGSSNIGDIKRNLLLGTIKTVASVATSSYIVPPPIQTTTKSSVKTYDISGRGLSKGSRMKQIKAGTVTKNDVTKKTTTAVPDNSKPISEAIDGSINTLNNLHSSGNSDRINDAGLMYGLSLKPKVVIYRPKFVPTNNEYDFLYGKPVGTTYKLNKISGYTEISNVHLEGEDFSLTTSIEMGEIEKILLSNNGIILPGIVTNLKSFKVSGENYNYIPDYSWNEFINSCYNINNKFYLVGDIVYYEGEKLLDPNGVEILKDNIIDELYYKNTIINYFIVEDSTYNFVLYSNWNSFIESSYNPYIDSTNTNKRFYIADGSVYYLPYSGAELIKLKYHDGRDVLPTDFIIGTTYIY